ncbi:MAG: hypothetical protein ACNA8N_11605 [Trueperaceae bacterium]
MSPLTALTLIAFGGIVVLALLIWSLLVPRRRPLDPPERPAAGRVAQRAPNVSNDEVRGARVRPPDRARSQDRVRSPDHPKSEDPFEEFLRAEGDDR